MTVVLVAVISFGVATLASSMCFVWLARSDGRGERCDATSNHAELFALVYAVVVAGDMPEELSAWADRLIAEYRARFPEQIP